jgi:hypothetical protein
VSQVDTRAQQKYFCWTLYFINKMQRKKGNLLNITILCNHCIGTCTREGGNIEIICGRMTASGGKFM